MAGKTYVFKDLMAVMNGDEGMTDITPEPKEKPLSRLEQNKLRKQAEERDAHHHDVHRPV